MKLTEPIPTAGVLAKHAWTSIQEAFTGYLLALIFGIPLAC